MANNDAKTNDYRLERKKRLAKAAKKEKKGSSDPTKLVSGIIIAVVTIAILCLAAFGLYQYGVPQKIMPAVTVGDRTYSVAEYSYYYTSVFQSYANNQSNLGFVLFDSSKDPALQNTTDEDGNTITYAELFKNTVIENLESSNYYLSLAKKEGIELSDEHKQEIDSTISEIETYATQYGYSTSRYISVLYGKGLNEKRFRSILEDQYLVTQYLEDETEKAYAAITDAEIEEEYAKNPYDYEIVDLRLLGISIPKSDDSDTATATGTDAEKSEEAKATEAKANEMLAKITDEASFIELAKEYCDEENKETFKEESATLAKSIKKSVVSKNISADLADWLFDAARATGDKTVFTAKDYVYVIYIINPPYRNEDALVNARHILVSFDTVKADLEANQATATDATATDATTAKASDGTKIDATGTGYSAEVVLETYERAKTILDQFKAGTATEDDFATLAEENSDDTGSVGENGQGGLYTDIEKGTMVEQFENWVYDEARKPGDTGIIMTRFGYHIMYFVSKNDEPSWKADIRTALGDNAMSEKTEEAKNAIENHATEKSFYNFAYKSALKLINKIYISSK